MSVRNLDKIFRPDRIVLIGARDKPDTPGVRVFRNLLRNGYRGVVYTVSAEFESIHGVPTFPSLEKLPRIPDLALICSPAELVPDWIEQCGKAGIRGVVILSGGFRECSDAGLELEARIADIAGHYPKMRILGPNSLGIINTHIGMNASQTIAQPKKGHLAFVSESRGLCNSILDWAVDQGIGFSYFVSIGNMLDVGFGDLIDYFGNDSHTRAIILYVQSIRDGRRFMSAARAFARSKPIVVYKSGRFATSARVAASHTGAMVGEDAVYEAAFERAGVVRVAELDDIFDVAELLGSQRLPQGRRLAIVSNAGAPAIVATDALLARGGSLATLQEETAAYLDSVLPPFGTHNNPVDLLDSAPPERYAAALSSVIKDRNVDAVLAIFASQAGTNPNAVARVAVSAAEQSHKPLLTAWMGGASVREGLRILNEAGLSVHSTPEQAVRAFMNLVRYARNLENLYETPKEMVVRFAINRHKLRKKLEPALRIHAGSLSEDQTERLLQAYEIPVARGQTVHSEAQAVEAAGTIGYPVVLKVHSPQILHKVDFGGVELDLNDEQDVREAYERIMRVTQAHGLGAKIKGMIVQKMVKATDSVELILGAKKDATFGAVIMVGLGGIATGVFHDRVVGLPPMNEHLARRMLESLTVWPILNGYRGRAPMALDRLIEVIIRFTVLIADYPEIEQFDINPLLVTPRSVMVLDAESVVGHLNDTKRHAMGEHLAIRPYPEEYSRRSLLKDGTPVILRSIRPEDEPLWHDMVASSSDNSIRFRFRSMFRKTTHQMAVRYCCIDYEREIAIVAETAFENHRKLIGVGGLIADAEHETAEFAILVSDPWQGKGLGSILLSYCLELASRWGIQRVVAETALDNHRMLEVFSKHGFSSEIHRDEDAVLLEKRIHGP
ncbi:MAG: bifunctional acetate--CoA ligase family protein/GNAT family N-acetyltransferase [Gammaproteobacteria bacterium]|jgi:acetyltransferase|nr:bifunctional acetate--CoA ligase family protein/GNAT family N-acetyltransferase [Gammaproteobacteria bacterium]